MAGLISSASLFGPLALRAQEQTGDPPAVSTAGESPSAVIASLQRELAEARQAYAQLEAQLREAQANLDLTLQQHGARLAEVTQASRTARADLAAMEARAQAAENAAGHAQRAREQAMTQVAGLRRTLVALERELAALRGAGATAVATSSDSAAPAESVQPDTEKHDVAVVSALEQKAAELQVENERLRQQLTEATGAASRARSSETIELRQQLDAARQQIASLEEALASARAAAVPVISVDSPAATETDPARARWETELRERAAQVQRLEEDNLRLAGELERLSLSRQSEIESLRIELAQLQAQLEGTRGREREVRPVATANAPTQPVRETSRLPAGNGALASNGSPPARVTSFIAAAPNQTPALVERLMPDASPGPVAASTTVQPVSEYRIKTIPPLPPGAGQPGRHSPTRPSEVVFRLPAPVVAAPPPAPAAPRYHVVTAGDTLTGISARHYGTAYRWEEIFEANRGQLAQPNLLRIGQRLRLP